MHRLLLLLVATGTSLAQNPIGVNQRAAVVVCQYRNTQPPLSTSAQWAAALNLHVNAFYQAASGGQTSFVFAAVPGVCQLDYADDAPTTPDPLNYANSVHREGRDAARFAEAAGVDLRTTRKLIVITNRARRGNATIGEWPIYDVAGRPFQPLAVTAFGEVDANGTPLLNGNTMTQPFAQTLIDVAAHEIGHLLGQYDLYPYFDGVDFSASWTQMGEQTWQHFDGYTRFKYGWLPAPGPRVRDFVMPLTGEINQPVNLSPPTTGGSELIRISLNPLDALTGTPSRPFFGLVAEARPRVGLDANLPGNYVDGVLVALVSEGLPQASYVVQPRQTTPELPLAAFRPGDRFAFDEAGLFLDVVSRQGDTFATRVRWQAPALPDVALDLGLPFGESRDIFLDSPTNGFGNFTFGNVPGDNVPTGPGDFPVVPYTIPWNDPDGPGLLPAVPGLPQPTPVTHRITIRARNLGRGQAANVRANVLIVRPTIPNIDFANLDSLNLLGNAQRVGFGNLAPGAAAVRTVDYRPDGSPFMVIVWLDKVDNEIFLHNQVAGEAFIIFQPAPGSPYEKVTVRLEAANLDERSRVRALFALPRDVPAVWETRLNRVAAAAAPGERVPFELSLQAPEGEKPQLVRPVLEGWTDFGDAAVPIGKIPVYVDLSAKTRTTLSVKADGQRATLSGRVEPSRAGLQVTVQVGGSDGSQTWLGEPAGELRVLTCAANGSFEAAMPLNAQVSYRAVATFLGAEELQPSVSAPVDFGLAANRPGRPRRPTDLRDRIAIERLPRPLRRDFEQAAERRGPAPASVEMVADGVAIDWTNGRLLADGFGRAQANLPVDRRRPAERKAALDDAFAKLKAAAGALPVTSEATLDSFAQASAELRQRVDELINTYRVVEEGPAPRGGYAVTIAVNLRGQPSLQRHVLPALPTLSDRALRLMPALAVPEPRVALAAAPRFSLPSRADTSYSGLVIDCTGLPVRRALAPRIVLADETEVWSARGADPELIQEKGAVGYLPTLEDATDPAKSRAGAAPLILVAQGVAGRFKANPVITADDAAALRQADERSGFLAELKVVFVVE